MRLKVAIMTTLLLLASMLFISNICADTIEFTGVPGAYGYVLRWGTTSGGPYPNYVDLGLSTSISLSSLSLSLNTTYYFIAEAYNDIDISIYSNEVSYFTGTIGPPEGKISLFFNGTLTQSKSVLHNNSTGRSTFTFH